MPSKRKKTGRPPSLSASLARVVLFALDRGVKPRDIATAAGVSSSTIVRMFNSTILANDDRCQAVLGLVADLERPAEAKTHKNCVMDTDPDRYLA
jgi:hypothetical protein